MDIGASGELLHAAAVGRVIERQKNKHSDTSGQHIGMNEKEVSQYSIARAVVAIIFGNWEKACLEREASMTVASAGSWRFQKLLRLPSQPVNTGKVSLVDEFADVCTRFGQVCRQKSSLAKFYTGKNTGKN